ncbi:MAG: ABC transporter substrate-binding protein [Oscillospiraceae bacterium]
MKFKRLKLIILVPLLLLVACMDTNHDTTNNDYQDIVNIEFSWWGNDNRNEYTIKAIDKFNELYPNIRVDCVYTEWSGYQTRMNMKMCSDTAEDVMQLNYNWINQYSPNGTSYYDLNKLSHIIDLSNFSEEELEFGMKNGHLNAIPISLNTQTFYYNQDMLDEYGLETPSTWEELFECASILKDEDIYVLGLGIKPAFLMCVSYVEQSTGKRFIDQNGKLGFGYKEVEMMLEFYDKLINEYVIPPIDKFDKINFKNKKYLGMLGWITDAYNYCLDIDFECTIGNFLNLSNSTNNSLCWYSKPSMMYAINKDTKYPEECALLLNFLLNSQEMAELQEFEKGVPLSKSAQDFLKDKNLLDTMEYKAFSKFQDYQLDIDTMPTYYENEAILEYFQTACQNVHYFKSSYSNEAVKFLKKVNDEVSEVSIGISKYSEYLGNM